MLPNQALPKDVQKQMRGRQQFKHGEQVVYEWEQNLDTVEIHITPPEWMLPKNLEMMKKQMKPGQKIPKFEIKIQSKHIKIGIEGNPAFIDEDLEKPCDASESFWMIEDDELHILLQKAVRAEVWACALKGHGQINAMVQEETQKKIL